jgi:hypothetical protein
MSHIDKTATPHEWRRSSYSTGSGSTCVEVSIRPTGVAVRDSKNPVGPELHFTMQEWRVFLLGVRSDEFDV